MSGSKKPEGPASGAAADRSGGAVYGQPPPRAGGVCLGGGVLRHRTLVEGGSVQGGRPKGGAPGIGERAGQGDYRLLRSTNQSTLLLEAGGVLTQQQSEALCRHGT